MDLVRNAESHYKVYYFERKIGGSFGLFTQFTWSYKSFTSFSNTWRIDKLKDLGTGF